MAAPNTIIADLLVPFAEMGSIRMRDAAGTLRKRIVVSLHFADAERVHSTLFPKDHIDWPAVREYLSDTHVGTTEWVRLVSLLHFINEPSTRSMVVELLTAAAAGTRVTTQGRDLNPLESLQLCFARAGVAPTWDTLCKTFVLCNLADIDVGLALSLLLSDAPASQLLPLCASTPPGGAVPALLSSHHHHSTVTHQHHHNNNNLNNGYVMTVVDTVVKHLPSCKHSQDDYSRTFAQLLHSDGCHVATHLIVRAIRGREEVQERARQNALAVLRCTKKPSLTRLLEEKAASSSSSDPSPSSAPSLAGGGGMGYGNNRHSRPTTHNDDSFKQFCHRARFPGNMSPRVCSACYFVAALPSFSSPGGAAKSNAFQLILGHDASPAILQALVNTTLISPETGTLRAFIVESAHTGPPCAALKQFRQECVPGGGGRSMPWTTVLRLYLAAYCRSPLNKDLWGHVLLLAAAAQVTTASGSSSAASLSGTTGNALLGGAINDGGSVAAHHTNYGLTAAENDTVVQTFVRAHPLALVDIIDLLLSDAA